jgi:hypothetical protein
MKILSIRKIIVIPLIIILFCCRGEDNLLEGLLINEFLAINDNCCMDEYDEYDDWVEIHNNSNKPVNIGGMYISDKVDDSNPYFIPESNTILTTITAKGFLVLWCDRQPEQGLLHLGFKLSGNGESIILIDRDGSTIIDGYTFPSQTADVSMGRNGEEWLFFENPTPGETN